MKRTASTSSAPPASVRKLSEDQASAGGDGHPPSIAQLFHALRKWLALAEFFRSLSSNRSTRAHARAVDVASQTGELRDAEQITFRAGYRQGRAAATRRGKRFRVHPDYDYGGGTNSYAEIATDVAVIELEHPINNAAIRPFRTHRKPSANDRVMVVSYARGRTEVPALEDGCKMTHAAADVLHYTCDIDFGSSGAPVFVMTHQGAQIASVMSSTGTRGSRKVALGVAMGPSVDRLIHQLNTSNAKSKFVKVGGATRGTGVITSRLPQIGK